MKKLLIDWQLWLRVVLCFLLPFVLVAGLMKASEEPIKQAFDTSITPEVGIVGLESLSPDLRAELEEVVVWKEFTYEPEVLLALESDSIDMGLMIPTDFYQDSMVSGKITVHYNSMKEQMEVALVLDILQEYEETLVENNLATVAVDERLVNPIKLDKKNAFNPLLQVGKIFGQAKGIIANVLNFMWLLLVVWLVRYLTLKTTTNAADGFGKYWLFNSLVIIISIGLVLFGVHQGLAIELEGTIKSVVLSTQQSLIWNKTSPMVYLWIVLAMTIMGILGIVAALTKDELKASNRTYWLVIVLIVVASFGFGTKESLGMATLATPLLNVFAIGQGSLNDTITMTEVWTSVGMMALLVVIMNGIWYKLLKNN